MHSLAEINNNKDSTGDKKGLEEVMEKSVTDTLKNIEDRGLNYPVLTTENILVHETQVFLQNPLLSKANLGKCITYMV